MNTFNCPYCQDAGCPACDSALASDAGPMLPPEVNLPDSMDLRRGDLPALGEGTPTA